MMIINEEIYEPNKLKPVLAFPMQNLYPNNKTISPLRPD